MLRSEMFLNCWMVVEFSLGIQTSSACLHCCATFPLLQMSSIVSAEVWGTSCRQHRALHWDLVLSELP